MTNTKINGAKPTIFAKRRPFIFAILLILLTLGVRIAGPTVIQQVSSISGIYIGICINLALVLILSIIISKLNWWKEIGFRKVNRPKLLWLYAPSLTIFIYNLTTKLIGGIIITDIISLITLAIFVLAIGFVEEVTFRGLMLTALIPRGKWIAVLTTTALFGFVHAANLLDGAPLSTIAIQVGYSLAVGFAFGAMALRGRLVWFLIIAHALADFMGLIEDAGKSASIKNIDVILLILVIISLVGYGLYLMKIDDNYFKPETSLPPNLN